MLILAGVSTAICLIVSLSTPPESMDRLKKFYKLVNPPGFWGAVARELDEDPGDSRRTLLISGTATALCAFSIFCMLVGIGSWLCHSPPPKWFPFRIPWIIALITTACVLTPIWWRLAFKQPEMESETS